MDLIKQYIIQSISAASNNLRLSTEKIEVVALLREAILKSEDLQSEIKEMKKITELSTFAIRLNEIYNYLTQNHIDLFKFSDKFKEHSQYLIKDLSHMLDIVSPVSLKKKLEEINSKKNEEIIKPSENNISVDLSKRKYENINFEKQETDEIKEKIIFEDEKEDEDFFIQNYETEILRPIKPLDSILKQLSKNEFNSEEILNFANLMNDHGEKSAKIGFEIIANMHNIISKALMLIRTRDLMPGKDVVESMRACLIVIVAVVRGKEVDITNYLNRAEEFGKKLQNLKPKDQF
jgi:hypothetical protein